MRNKLRAGIIVLGIVSLLWVSSPLALAQTQAWPIPTIKIGVGEAKDPGEVSVLIQILVLLTVLSLAPAILIMMTSFTRLVVVFSFLRHALGITSSAPQSALDWVSPVLNLLHHDPSLANDPGKGFGPLPAKKISQAQALEEALKPIRKFMFKQTREKDLALFIQLTQIPRPKNQEEIPTTVLLPAFMISELKTAFQIGVILYIPFLIVDMVVSSVLLSMGMMMLPPVMISLPFKVLLFVLVDGWNLLVGSLVKSFY